MTMGDSEDELYYVNHEGLFYHKIGGSTTEQLMNGELTSLGDRSIDFQALYKYDDKNYMVFAVDSQETRHCYRYTYDAEVSAVPENQITVYALEDTNALQQVITAYQKAYPDVVVKKTIGISGEDGVTAEDAVKSLNTEMLAGKGPDVLVLDGLPTESYKEKGVLADLSSYVKAADKKEGLFTNITDAYAGNGKEAVEQLLAGNGNETDGFVNKANALEEAAEANTKKAADSNIVKELASKQKDSSEYTQALNDLLDRVNTAYTLQNKALFNSQVKKVAGQDSEIELNGVKYTGDSNSYSINGLTIEALAETGDSAISITTSTDTQGVYDKVKDFLTEYNNIINEMTKLYNADSAGSYEPLTDDEKDQMSDKEIEKWETKIKDSLLRRDSTLGSVMTAMQTAMMSSVEIGGKKYSLSSFGISTLGFLNAAENEQNAYHIDGDEDDANTSGKTDKLMAAINDDPDTVMQFMQQLSTNLYSAIGDKMKSTDLSSAFTIYNDKQMKTEYTNYTKTIKEWEKKISDREDYYYNKFTQMESAMTKLNSTQSSISSYFS